jgi:hypothetical protein
MPVFIGLVLSWLAARIGVRTALGVALIAVVAGVFGVYTLAIKTAMEQISIPQFGWAANALSFFPSNTAYYITAIGAAETARWIFEAKTAAIRYFVKAHETRV